MSELHLLIAAIAILIGGFIAMLHATIARRQQHHQGLIRALQGRIGVVNEQVTAVRQWCEVIDRRLEELDGMATRLRRAERHLPDVAWRVWSDVDRQSEEFEVPAPVTTLPCGGA